MTSTFMSRTRDSRYAAGEAHFTHMLPTRAQRFKKRLIATFSLRFHMSLILAAVFASGVLASKGLLELGVHSLHLRYPLAVLGSYLVFLGLVRVWIWFASFQVMVWRWPEASTVKPVWLPLAS